MFTESQYLDRYGADSLLFQLARVLLASRSVMMIGFGYTDPFVKLLFHQVGKLTLQSPKANWFITSEDRVTQAFREYLRGVGFIPVILPSSISHPTAVLDFLERLVTETSPIVDDRSLRAKLLLRMLTPLRGYRGSERLLRIRATPRTFR